LRSEGEVQARSWKRVGELGT